MVLWLGIYKAATKLSARAEVSSEIQWGKVHFSTFRVVGNFWYQGFIGFMASLFFKARKEKERLYCIHGAIFVISHWLEASHTSHHIQEEGLHQSTNTTMQELWVNFKVCPLHSSQRHQKKILKDKPPTWKKYLQITHLGGWKIMACGLFWWDVQAKNVFLFLKDG